MIANYGVGVNHIDLAAAAAHGIPVSNTPGVLTDATADLAMTLMLMLCRRAGEGERELGAGAWAGWRPTHLVGQAMTGKRLGIIGMGRIGKAVAQRAHFGFGMEIGCSRTGPRSMTGQVSAAVSWPVSPRSAPPAILSACIARQRPRRATSSAGRRSPPCRRRPM